MIVALPEEKWRIIVHGLNTTQGLTAWVAVGLGQQIVQQIEKQLAEGKRQNEPPKNDAQ